MTERPRAWLGSVVRLLLGAAILGGLLWWLGPDWSEVRDKLRLHWGYLALALVGTGLATAFTAARWQLLNERMTQTRLPYGTYFHYIALTRFLGLFSSMLLMDLVGRGVGLKAAGSKQGLGRLLTPVLLERLLDLLLPAVILGWAWAVHETALREHPWISLTVITIAFGLAVIPFIQPIAGLALGAYLRLKRWRGLVVDAEVVQISQSTAAWISIHSVGRYFSILLQFFGMGAAAGAVLPAVWVASAMAIQQLSAPLAFTPGGLGVQDALWVLALGWLGSDEAVIALFLLAVRVLMVLNFGLLALVTLPMGARSRASEEIHDRG